MTNYNWRVHVRITGTRDGWGRTLVDTPTFDLHNNTKPDTVASVARDMFAGLTEPDDQVHVTVSSIDDGGSETAAYTFGGLGA